MNSNLCRLHPAAAFMLSLAAPSVCPKRPAPQITLRTITDVAQAVAWLRSTYFYVRVKVRRSGGCRGLCLHPQAWCR